MSYNGNDDYYKQQREATRKKECICGGSKTLEDCHSLDCPACNKDVFESDGIHYEDPLLPVCTCERDIVLKIGCKCGAMEKERAILKARKEGKTVSTCNDEECSSCKGCS